jgi:hypothetical protein
MVSKKFIADLEFDYLIRKLLSTPIAAILEGTSFYVIE